MTREALQRCKFDMIDMLGNDPGPVAQGLAHHVIINCLGYNFWDRECCSTGNGEMDGYSKRAIWEINLAHFLWRALEMEGFAEWLIRAKKGSFRPAFFELSSACLLARSFERVIFNIPSKKKGSDYDLKALSGLGLESLHVEVKTRMDPLDSIDRMIKIVEKARQQLPTGGDGAVIVNMINNPTIDQAYLDEALCRKIRQSHRIKFVLYLWDSSLDDNVIAWSWACVDSNGRNHDILSHMPKITWEEDFIKDLCG